MALKKSNTQDIKVREFNEYLEAQEVFEDNNEEQSLRLKALDYILEHKEIFYVLRMLNKLFANNNIDGHIFIDYAFAYFANKPKRDEDFHEMFIMLQSNDAYLRNQAIMFLQQYGEEAKEFLRTLLDNDDKDIRIFAINILGDVRYEDSVEMLRYLLMKETAENKPNVNVIMTAVDYIGEIGSKQDIELLEAIKQQFSHEPYVQFGIDTAISRIRG
jgi:HEAT repeat protein